MTSLPASLASAGGCLLTSTGIMGLVALGAARVVTATFGEASTLLWVILAGVFLMGWGEFWVKRSEERARRDQVDDRWEV